MVSSKEVIAYLKKNLNKRFYASMFVAGSIPKELIVQSDLDIFIVMKDKHRKEFFNNLMGIMDEFMKDKDKIIYSFYRGPLKYKNKGLIHFIIYTDVVNSGLSSREQFAGESIPILKNLIMTAKVINGKSLKALTKKVNWSDL